MTKELSNDAAVESFLQEQAFANETSETSPAAAQLDAEGEKLLVFQVKEYTWVEMRCADNSVLVSRLFKAGTKESFKVPGPLSLVIGNAVGVTLSLHGQPLDLSGNASNVARLNVK